MSHVLFYFVHLSLLIGLPALVFAFVVHNYWFVRTSRWRAIRSIFAAGILTPTVFVGHGLLVMPSSIGVVYALRSERDPVGPSVVIWAVGSVLFFGIDTWLSKRRVA